MKIKGRKFDYLHTTKVLPNGYKVRLQIIEHPGAALIIPLINKDKLIMLRQYRAVLNKYLYELPAGTLDKKEGILKCARRELIEETGYDAKRITKLGKIYPVPGYSTEIIYIFKAEGLIKKEIANEPDEVIELKTFSRGQIRKLFKSRQIEDAKTICGLALAGWI